MRLASLPVQDGAQNLDDVVWLGEEKGDDTYPDDHEHRMSKIRVS
jgi:hypothetical protein